MNWVGWIALITLIALSCSRQRAHNTRISIIEEAQQVIESRFFAPWLEKQKA